MMVMIMLTMMMFLMMTMITMMTMLPNMMTMLLYQDYCSGALHDELNAVKQIPIGSAFPGAASNIMSAGQPELFNSTR